MNDQTGPVYRATTANRVIAGIVLAAALGAVGWVIAGGGSPIKVVGLTLGAAVIGFLAFGALRFQVRAEPDHLAVCWGGPLRKFPWSQIKSFGVGGRNDRDVYIVLANKQKKRLPLMEVTNQQVSATEVRDALQRYWRSHRR
ncbi:MAG: hypothetical protein ACRDZ3_08955 [Acidimicrobiia bacterium]